MKDFPYFIYEVWNRPSDGSLTVLEAGSGFHSEHSDEENKIIALNLAQNKKKTYPHMDFWVREIKITGYSSQSWEANIIFKTEKNKQNENLLLQHWR